MNLGLLWDTVVPLAMYSLELQMTINLSSGKQSLEYQVCMWLGEYFVDRSFEFQILFWFHFTWLLDISRHDLICSTEVHSTNNILAFPVVKIKHELVHLKKVWLRKQEKYKKYQTIWKILPNI